jgi:hypothetical protein
LADDFLAQSVNLSTETGDGFEDQVKARGQLLQYRPHLGLHFVGLSFVRHR